MKLLQLTNKFTKYTSRILRTALRFDQDDEQESTTALIERIPSAASGEPLNQLLQAEAETLAKSRLPPFVRHSYSQAAAYTVLLIRFNGSKAILADWLGITIATLNKRIDVAAESLCRQPTLFDDLISIAADFIPPRRHRLRVSPIAVIGFVFRRAKQLLLIDASDMSCGGEPASEHAR